MRRGWLVGFAAACVGTLATATAATAAPALHVAPGGSDGGPCSAARPCASFDRAYHVARAGQVVQVRGGAYPNQRITPRANAPGSPVVFRPAAGARVTVGDLSVTGSQVAFERMAFESWTADRSAHHLTFRSVQTGAFFVNSASFIRILGGSVGPAQDEHAQIASWPAGTRPHDILIDRVRFHDFRRSGPDVHIECLQIGSGLRITIRRSRFVGCDVFALFLTEYNGGGPPTAVRIENNVFGAAGSGGFYALAFNQQVAWSDVVVRHNSFLQATMWPDPQAGPPVSGFRVSANVGVAGPTACDRRIEWSRNVWASGRRCAPGDRIAPTGFRDPARADVRLRPGAAAIDRGDPKSFPATDVDGHRRPRGRGPDAGAVESG